MKTSVRIAGFLVIAALVLAGCGDKKSKGKADFTASNQLNSNIPINVDPNAAAPQGNNAGSQLAIVVDSFAPGTAVTKLGGSIDITFHIVNAFNPDSLQLRVNNQTAALAGEAASMTGDPATSATISIPADANTLKKLTFFNKHDNELKLEVENSNGEHAKAVKYIHFALDTPELQSFSEQSDCDCGKPCLQFFTFSSVKDAHYEIAFKFDKVQQGGMQSFKLTDGAVKTAEPNDAMFSLTAGKSENEAREQIKSFFLSKGKEADEDLVDGAQLQLGAVPDAFNQANQGDCPAGSVQAFVKASFAMPVLVEDENGRLLPSTEITLPDEEAPCIDLAALQSYAAAP